MKRKCFHTDNNGNGTWIRVRDEGDKITMTYKKVIENNIKMVLKKLNLLLIILIMLVNLFLKLIFLKCHIKRL